MRNIDRLLTMAEVDEDATFLDLGSGTGIALVYVRKHYKFRSMVGVELQETLVSLSEKNLNTSGSETKILVRRCNASDYVVSPERHYIFLFNPFGHETLNLFLTKNIDSLRKTNSMMLISNDHLARTAENFGERIGKDERYRLSVVSFGDSQA